MAEESTHLLRLERNFLLRWFLLVITVAIFLFSIYGIPGIGGTHYLAKHGTAQIRGKKHNYAVYFIYSLYVVFQVIFIQNIANRLSKKIKQTFTVKIRTNYADNSSDGRVVSASASGDVDLGLIPELGQTNHFKIGIHSFLLDAQH